MNLQSIYSVRNVSVLQRRGFHRVYHLCQVRTSALQADGSGVRGAMVDNRGEKKTLLTIIESPFTMSTC